MVQISKLTKAELAITGFKNRSIASRFMKQILNKKARDFKDKVELINALTTKYFEMKNYGIDLNDIAKVEKNVKQVDKFVKKSQEEFEQFKIDNMDDETVIGWNIDDYLKEINYKLPENKNYTDVKKKLKNRFYYNWEGVEEVQKTITDLYRQQDTAFKFHNMDFITELTNLKTKPDKEQQLLEPIDIDRLKNNIYNEIYLRIDNILLSFIDQTVTFNEILNKIKDKEPVGFQKLKCIVPD